MGGPIECARAGPPRNCARLFQVLAAPDYRRGEVRPARSIVRGPRPGGLGPPSSLSSLLPITGSEECHVRPCGTAILAVTGLGRDALATGLTPPGRQWTLAFPIPRFHCGYPSLRLTGSFTKSMCYHQHRGVRAVGRLFSSTSRGTGFWLYFPHLFSVTSRDIPSFSICLFFPLSRP